MYASIITALLVIQAGSVLAQQQRPSVVCQPNQCFQGYSNVTLGAVLSSSGAPAQIHLLPGQYSSSTSPQLLHDMLTSSSASLSPSPGFNLSSSVTLPLNVQLQPGIATFTGPLYSGRSAFAALPSSPVSNSSTPLNAVSVTLSSGIWAVVKSGSDRLVLWDSIPDLTHRVLARHRVQAQAFAQPLVLVNVRQDLQGLPVNLVRKDSLARNVKPVQVTALNAMTALMDRTVLHALEAHSTSAVAVPQIARFSSMDVASQHVANRSSLTLLRLPANPVTRAVPAVQDPGQIVALHVRAQQSSGVISGLGVCLSDLVVTQASQTGTLPPLPTITGINSPTNNTTIRRPLTWWEILLMTLGCAFIFVVILWLCRRRAKTHRAKETAIFAKNKGLDQRNSWRWRLVRFGEKLFGHPKSKRVVLPHPNGYESEDIKLSKLKAAEEARRPAEDDRFTLGDGEEEDMEKLIGSYRYSKPASPEPSRYNAHLHRITADDARSLSDSSLRSSPSIYSQLTGVPRRGPDPRQPVKKELASRFSMSTLSSSEHHHQSSREYSSKNPFLR
ncbi:hypothetical protein AX17_004701 [Amanita inopinata Kibby_2008]|nr:hypothetical protein AX17_004701 [Amanita inopinata Kibby_2008]